MPTLFDSHEEFAEWFSKDIESHAISNSGLDERILIVQLSSVHIILSSLTSYLSFRSTQSSASHIETFYVEKNQEGCRTRNWGKGNIGKLSLNVHLFGIILLYDNWYIILLGWIGDPLPIDPKTKETVSRNQEQDIFIRATRQCFLGIQSGPLDEFGYAIPKSKSERNKRIAR